MCALPGVFPRGLADVLVHAHALVLDGVFTEAADGTLSPGAGSSGRRRELGLEREG